MQNRFNELVQTDLQRFWDTETKEMIYPEFFEIEPVGVIIYKIQYHFEVVRYKSVSLSDMLLDSRFVGMKPTGLPDKNGKLIYESDIANTDDGDGWILGKSIVVFEQGCFCLKDIDDYKNDHFAIFENKVPLIDGRIEEIIGNIYETPELLEGKSGEA